MLVGADGKSRCLWVGSNKVHYEKYHDEEWAVPEHSDQKHFEMLILEGAQAGLSWETILKRREGYRKAFKGFHPEKVARMTDEELEELTSNPTIIRNRLKIFSARNNARSFLKIQREFGSFDAYVWGFVENKPIINHWKEMKEVPVKTAISDALSKDLQKKGMNFVGSTIIYAYMQAIGMVNDHVVTCWRHSCTSDSPST